MSDLITTDQEHLLPYLHSKKMGLEIPTPFAHDIFLFDTHIAGTTHIESIDQIVQTLQSDDKLIFYREPRNEHDPQAIRIETMNKQKIGYIPQQDNIVFARLMEAGKELFGKVTKIEQYGNWWRIAIKIYMHEG